MNDESQKPSDERPDSGARAIEDALRSPAFAPGFSEKIQRAIYSSDPETMKRLGNSMKRVSEQALRGILSEGQGQRIQQQAEAAARLARVRRNLAEPPSARIIRDLTRIPRPATSADVAPLRTALVDIVELLREQNEWSRVAGDRSDVRDRWMLVLTFVTAVVAVVLMLDIVLR